METRDMFTSDSKPCEKCGKKSWIYIIKTLGNDHEKHYFCSEHYVELIDRYLEDKIDEQIELFPEVLKLKEIPLYKAQLRYGGAIPEKYLLQSYQEDLEKEMKKTREDIEQQEKQPNSQYFLNLLEKELSEKMLVHRLILTQLKLRKNED